MVKVGDKVRCVYPWRGYNEGDIAVVDRVTPEDNNQPYRIDGKWWPIVSDGYFKPVATDPLQHFTMNALVEAVSKAIDAGDTQSARAIIDAMEGK